MRYNRGMIETPQPLPPEPSVTGRAPEPASLLERLATLRLENAALHAENLVLRQRVREREAQHSRCSRPLGKAERLLWREQ